MKNIVQEARFARLTQFIDLEERKLIELGPQALPTVLKSEADITYLDYETKKQICSIFPEDMWDTIPETDILLKSDNYKEYVSATYDCCIANHVIEHTDDVISWLQSINCILKDDGLLFLSIPDKKYTFDKYRANTPLAHLITDYFLGGKWSEKEHILEIAFLYDQEFVGKEFDFQKTLNKAFLAQQLDRNAWLGLHRHVFEPETFADQIIAPLIFGGFLDCEVIYCDRSSDEVPGHEFHCILRKTSCPRLDFDGEAFLGKNQLQEQACAEDAVAVPPATPPALEPEPASEPVSGLVTFSFGPKMIRLLKLFEKCVHSVSRIVHKYKGLRC